MDYKALLKKYMDAVQRDFDRTVEQLRGNEKFTENELEILSSIEDEVWYD